jgi:hypothetical protein
MTKKYSIQTENDKVVSVEVDGVSYTDPEDIPDKFDRKKIKTLIARTTNPDFDDTFDEEFAEDVREMKKQSAMFPRLIISIFLGIGVLLLIITGFSTASAIKTISREESAPGQVVDLVPRNVRDSSTGDVTQITYPVVEYTPLGQARLKVQMSEGSSTPDNVVGDQVVVLYDPQRPTHARIKSTASDFLLWLLPGITFFVGAVFVAVAVVIYKVWPPNKS